MAFGPAPARADVDSVTSAPATLAVNPRNAVTPLGIAWTVNRTETVGGAGGAPVVRVVSSGSAQLLVNGGVVATLAGALAQNSGNLSIGQSETLVFNETLTLSAAQGRQIANAAPGTVVIRRMFSDTLRVVTADIPVYASLGNAGELTVRRIGLAFENNARTDVVRQGDALRAVADVSFYGNGLLRGEWRLVGPAASLGDDAGRILQIVRQNLASSGQGRARIVSPPLPTRENGLHLLSFSVQDTTAGFEIPVLRYVVIDGGGGQNPLEITPVAPGDGVAAGMDTVFSWRTLAGVAAYQLDVFESGGKTPVAGQLVPGTDLSLSLSALVRENLDPGKTYEWQVRAFDREGRTIGLSPRRGMTLRAP